MKNSKNNNIVFDVAIIGAGVSGAAIARKLSLYKLKVVLIEKDVDISFGVSKANSGIIHAGFHHKPDTLKSKLEIQGNLMFEKFQNELHFPFKRVGIIVAAFSYEEMKTVEQLYQQGIDNKIPQIEICSRERVLYLEPELSHDVTGGLYAPTGGIIEPYRYVFSLIESAENNGVEVYINFEVVKSEKKDYYKIYSKNGNSINAKYVINAAGLYADDISSIFKAEKFEIKPRKGEEFLLERNASGFPDHVIFPVPVKNSKGTLVIPTVEGTMMVGPTAEEIDDKSDLSTAPENLEKVFTLARKMVPKISKKDIITSFAGLRPVIEGNDFYIDISKKASHFIQVAGIQSPGLTASPAIGEYVKDLLKKDGLELIEKESYNPCLEDPKAIRELSIKEAEELIKSNPAYGNIICRCEKISEAEIINAVDKGHTTLDGVKFYTRASMGKCQGGFCTYKILHIISDRTGIPIEEITKRGSGSFIIKEKLSDRNIKV